jgi:hypothetical protein
MIDTLTQNILNLDKNEQDVLFRVLTENADILIKVIPTAPLLAYIVSGSTNVDHAIIQAYNAWKNSNQ